MIPSDLPSPPYMFVALICCRRTRTKLASGQLTVKGDQWPLMLYAKQEFDAEEPWDGLFRSELLVWVRTLLFYFRIILYFARRPSSISSLRPALWRKKTRQRDRATLVSTA